LIRYKGPRVGANESRRHLAHYTKGIVGSAPYRARLTQINSASEAAQILIELAEKIAGVQGRIELIGAINLSDSTHIRDINFEEREEPSEGNGDSESNIKTPSYFSSFAPIAKP
jgi:hypothetical protein